MGSMDEKLQRTLGEAAQAARPRLGPTQEEVAKQVGLARKGWECSEGPIHLCIEET
jgi:DNA-binding XRE family transcriptional regulator